MEKKIKSKISKKYKGFLIININQTNEKHFILKTLIQNNSCFYKMDSRKKIENIITKFGISKYDIKTIIENNLTLYLIIIPDILEISKYEFCDQSTNNEKWKFFFKFKDLCENYSTKQKIFYPDKEDIYINLTTIYDFLEN